MANPKVTEVSEFYSGKCVFITGGTGFLGKTLIEKLLYSCSGIDNIYLLIRNKKGNHVNERIEQLKTSSAFDRLKAIKPKLFMKIIPLSGNIYEKNLGLSSEALKILEEKVAVVFHLAATVNFNEPLKDALEVNVNGTQEVIELCRRIKKLQALIHVSTAYSNADRLEIDEIVYQPHHTLEHARSIAEQYSDGGEDINKLLGNKPNTYAYSKAFAEAVVMRERGDLPVAIVRPSIVVSSLRDPCPGWIDNWNGATGIFVGMPSGVLKVMVGRGENITDLIPVDIVTNLMIVAATKCQSAKELKVYNCCTGTSNPITIRESARLAYKISSKYSLCELAFPCFILTSNQLLYKFLLFFLQIIPAFIVDLWAMFTGRKVMQMKIQKRLWKMNQVLQFFLLREWRFADNNVRNLIETLSEDDKQIFNFDVKTIDWESNFEDYILGARKYLLKIENRRVDN